MRKIDTVLTIEEMAPVVGGVVRPQVRRVPSKKGPGIRHGNLGDSIGNAITQLMLYCLEHNKKKKN